MKLQPIKEGWGAESRAEFGVCSLCQEGLEGDTIFSVLLSRAAGRGISSQPEPKCSVIPFPSLPSPPPPVTLHISLIFGLIYAWKMDEFWLCPPGCEEGKRK